MLKFMVPSEPLKLPETGAPYHYACMFIVAKGKPILLESIAPDYMPIEDFVRMAAKDLTRMAIREGAVLDESYAECDIRVFKKDKF